MQWKDRRALVVGLARSGVAAAGLLCRLGAHVTANDAKPLEELADAQELQALPAELRLGQPAEPLLAGHDLLVISPGIPYAAPFIQKALSMGIEVVGEVELAARVNRAPLVAITGTNGKTTTTTLTGEILKAAGFRTFVVGNIGYPFSAIADQAGPEDRVVCEISSFQCESMSRYHPQVGAVLNITEDHLNRHGDMRTYVQMKRRIFQNQTEADVAVFNRDDATCREMAQGLCGRVAYFSRREAVPFGAYAQDGGVYLRLDGDARRLCAVDDIFIPGPHNLENALAASLLASLMGAPDEAIARTLRTFRGVEHRIEFVREWEGVRYIDDSKGTNVDATCRAVEAMAAPTLLILGGSEKNVDFAPLAEAIRRSGHIEAAVLIGQTADKIAAALDAAGYKSYVHEGYSLERAVARCRSMAKPGYNVLLSPACASFDMFENCEQRGDAFKALVMEMK